MHFARGAFGLIKQAPLPLGPALHRQKKQGQGKEETKGSGERCWDIWWWRACNRQLPIYSMLHCSIHISYYWGRRGDSFVCAKDAPPRSLMIAYPNHGIGSPAFFLNILLLHLIQLNFVSADWMSLPDDGCRTLGRAQRIRVQLCSTNYFPRSIVLRVVLV